MRFRYKSHLRAAFSPQSLATLASIVLAILSILGFIFSPADGVILGVLSLLNASLIIGKLSEERFHRKLIALAENRQATAEALLHVDALPPLANRILDANEIWVSGLTLSTFLVSHRVLLRTFIAHGGKLRILIAPREGAIVDEIFLYFPMERALYENGMRISLDIMDEMQYHHEKQVEARILPVFPSHLLLLINPKRSDGEAQVHLNVYQRSPESSPAFIIHREESSFFYETFLTEFESLWNCSSKYSAINNKTT